MPETTRLEQYCLALSYLERIEGEIAHWTKLRSDNLLARTKYDEVRARYDQHLGRAKRAVDERLSAAKQDLPIAESMLDTARAAQRKLGRIASKGGADPEKLNARGRQIAVELAKWTAQADELRAIVEAKTTGDLGGGIDLPLDEYAVRLDLLPPTPRLSTGRLTALQSNLLSGAVMLVLVFGAIGVIYFLRAAPRANFFIAGEALSSGFVEVRCENQGNRPLYLYVPWPNGSASPLPGVSGTGNSWGLMLYLRIAGENEFRLYENADALWKMRGSYLESGEPIAVDGGARLRVFLDLDKLKATGLDADAVVIECTKAGGAVQAREQIDLSGRLRTSSNLTANSSRPSTTSPM